MGPCRILPERSQVSNASQGVVAAARVQYSTQMQMHSARRHGAKPKATQTNVCLPPPDYCSRTRHGG